MISSKSCSHVYRASKMEYGSVIGFVMSSGAPLDNSASKDLHYSIVDFDGLLLQLTVDELTVLSKGLSHALQCKPVPDSLFESPSTSWHTIKHTSGDSQHVSFRFGAMSWNMTSERSRQILNDVNALLSRTAKPVLRVEFRQE